MAGDKGEAHPGQGRDGQAGRPGGGQDPGRLFGCQGTSGRPVRRSPVAHQRGGGPQDQDQGPSPAPSTVQSKFTPGSG